MKKYIFLLCLAIFFIGCAKPHCRPEIDVDGQTKIKSSLKQYKYVYIQPIHITHPDHKNVTKKLVKNFTDELHADLDKELKNRNIHVTHSDEDNLSVVDLNITFTKIKTSFENLTVGEVFPYRAAFETVWFLAGQRNKDVHIYAQYYLYDSKTHKLLAQRDTIFTMQAVLKNFYADLKYDDLRDLKYDIKKDILSFVDTLQKDKLSYKEKSKFSSKFEDFFD